MKVDVLDKGYVRLVDSMGGDLSVVNAARVSYDKESTKLEDRDKKLIKFLVKHNHTSPFRHSAITFEIYAPLMVARQWWKYAVSSTHIDDQNGWNESSRRYITEDVEFYVPDSDQWRGKPDNSKQGSGDPISTKTGNFHTNMLNKTINDSIILYQEAMQDGIAPELARLYLPAYAMYVRWRWTVSLQGVITFLDQRIEHTAQLEIQQYAQAVLDLTKQKFPATFESWGLIQD
jgi:thymidylate synthase (FAD)